MTRWMNLIAGFCASFTAASPTLTGRRHRAAAVRQAGRASGLQWLRCLD